MSRVPNRREGGRFILDSVNPQLVFTPEDLNEEQRMIAAMTSDFIQKEVLPDDQAIEGQNFELLVHHLKKAGELGLLGAEVPEQYGGSALDQVSATLITEH